MNGAMYLHCVYIMPVSGASKFSLNLIERWIARTVLHRHVELEAIRLELK